MDGKYCYGIETDALDELGRLEDKAFFISCAIGCMADIAESGETFTAKCW